MKSSECSLYSTSVIKQAVPQGHGVVLSELRPHCGLYSRYNLGSLFALPKLLVLRILCLCAQSATFPLIDSVNESFCEAEIKC